MKEIPIILYQCETCGTNYSTSSEALKCESKPLCQDKGVKLGDIITVTMGDGSWKKAVVERKMVFSKDWGHYAWERYWHTVGLQAKIIDSWGSRQLTFDQYKVD